MTESLPVGTQRRKLAPPLPNLNDPSAKIRLAAAIAQLDLDEERRILDWMEQVMDDTGWSPQE